MDNKTQTAPSKWHKKLLEGYARHTQERFAWLHDNPARSIPEDVLPQEERDEETWYDSDTESGCE